MFKNSLHLIASALGLGFVANHKFKLFLKLWVQFFSVIIGLDSYK